MPSWGGYGWHLGNGYAEHQLSCRSRCLQPKGDAALLGHFLGSSSGTLDVLVPAARGVPAMAVVLGTGQDVSLCMGFAAR